ncbi:hypothetical protein EMCRGX_G005975 [Ephydatia muelleri]
MGRAGPIPWPARSPDLSPLDLWLWGYLKNKVYSHSVATLQELRDAIEDELQAIPAVMVHNATLSVVEDAKKLISINELQLVRLTSLPAAANLSSAAAAHFNFAAVCTTITIIVFKSTFGTSCSAAFIIHASIFST